MKKVVLFFVLTLGFISCKKEESKKENFPQELAKVFEKHGGIETWRKAKLLSFNVGEEIHTIALQSRKTVINHPNYSVGFNGKEVWLNQEKEGFFNGNPTFYYNLTFYFYAMPFVLADDGIIYEKVDDLVFEGTNYPGYKISYEANVGTSPDDNYIIYYNPKTYQMEWLGYTVTFKSKKPSERFNMIKYNKWESVNGLVLPKEIIWYTKDKNGNPTKPSRPATEFTLPLISDTQLADSFFEKPKK